MAFNLTLICNYTKKLTQKKMIVLGFFASIASIVSVLGWAAEKFWDASDSSIKSVSLGLMIVIFFLEMFFLIASFVEYQKIRDVQDNSKLYHKITHQLRNAVSLLKDLEFKTLELIEKAEASEFERILENDALKTRNILENFCAKITSSVLSQIKSYFVSNGINQNVRVVIKYFIPNGGDHLNWEIKTLYVDHETWDNEEKRRERNSSKVHIVKENSDFEEILLGKKPVFVSNGLSKIQPEEYKNSSLDWRNCYNATIVVPVKSKPDGKENVVYYGFLTADSMNSENQDLFSEEMDSPVLNIMAHAADALAVWYITYDNHTKTLENALFNVKGNRLLPPDSL